MSVADHIISTIAKCPKCEHPRSTHGLDSGAHGTGCLFETEEWRFANRDGLVAYDGMARKFVEKCSCDLSQDEVDYNIGLHKEHEDHALTLAKDAGPGAPQASSE